MATTYLQAVNSVLRRLRETEVATVSATNYSKLIGDFINDAKVSVEAAYNWNALSNTITVATVGGTHNYTLTDSGVRFKVQDVWNDTKDSRLRLAPATWMNEQLIVTSPQQGSPTYYNFKGQDANGDTQVNFFPVPDGVYSIKFNVFLPQPVLSSDSTVIKVPADVVIQNAYARALVERGEDNGLASSEAYALAKTLMADYIALESNRYLEDTNWVPN
jgi:hypothetical protein